MKYNDLPFSQYHLIDVIATALSNRAYEWGDESNLFEDNPELERYTEMARICNYIVQTTPDEVGEMRFAGEEKVVERSSGVFSVVYDLISLDDGVATIKSEDDETEVFKVPVSKIREDGIAFVPSNELENKVELTGTPLSDIEIEQLFLDATVANGSSSKAWTEMRFLSIDPNVEEGENSNDYYAATVEWARRWCEKMPKMEVGTIVTVSIPHLVISNGYSSGSSIHVGHVEKIEKRSDGLYRYHIRTKNTSTWKYRWQINPIAEPKKLTEEVDEQ